MSLQPSKEVYMEEEGKKKKRNLGSIVFSNFPPLVLEEFILFSSLKWKR